MYSQYDIGQKGEQAAVDALRKKGWTITTWNTSAPGSTDIEARSSSGKLLVQVKAAVSPNEPGYLSSEEERNVKSRATRIGAKAWEARVWLDENLNVLKTEWRQLE